MYLINSMLQGFHWRPREARKIFFPTFDEQLGSWFLVFIFSLFYSDSSQIGSTLTWDMRSGALLLPSWFLFAPVLRFKLLISYRARKIFFISDLQQFCALGEFLGHFNLASVLQIKVPKSVVMIWVCSVHRVQYYRFKGGVFSRVIDLIFNFFFFWMLGNVANDVWICAEKRPLGDLPGLSIRYICSQRSRFCHPGDALQSDIPEIAESEVRA